MPSSEPPTLQPYDTAEAGRFRCTECGDCCRRHRVPITASDMARLVRATGLPARALVDWLSPDDVDMSGEPESFVLLPAGRRLPVLAHVAPAGESRESTCRFLDTNRCTVYAARPACCRSFPLELADDVESGKRRLIVLPDAQCPGSFDGSDVSGAALRRLDERCRELRQHVHLVGAWNHRQRRRRLANGRVESADAFLAFVVLRASETALL
ncbi:MAG TPA: YkgJ family cysteine cluster protein [Polyangiaceae bacterium]